MHTTPTPAPAQTARTVGAQVAEQATAFAATLCDDQRAQLHRPYGPATVRNWSNFPQATLDPRRRRVGLRTATLSAEQWDALYALLAAATGPGRGVGFDRIRQHLDADDHLRNLGGRHGYGRGNFCVAFLGDPSTTGTWELQFGGHHLAVAHTYADGVLTGATPSFRGIEPFPAFVHDGVRHDPERRSWQALTALLAGLDGTQLARATLRGHQPDLLLGPGRDWCFPHRHRGIPGADLTAAQRGLLLAAVASYVEDVDPVSAARILARYRGELDATHVAWAGSPALDGAGDYVRIDGPSVWIEFSLHDGIVLDGPHPHAVWRDRITDYGGTRFRAA